MFEDLRKNKKLLIISDTGMYYSRGKYFAFAPVVKENNYFLRDYNKVTWVGYNRLEQKDNKSYINCNNEGLKYVIFPRVGGSNIISKLNILLHYPMMIIQLTLLLFSHNKIHVRAPSHPAFIAMVLSLFFKKKKFWFKYAGSWVDTASKFYEFQRFFLKKLGRNSVITVNGKWPGNNGNIISFENPCIEQFERQGGFNALTKKELNGKVNFCFVGALNKHKGVHLIIDALKEIGENSKIGTIHFIGDGSGRKEFEKQSRVISAKIIFHGFLGKYEINKIYELSHFILLPSKSEGFPKVIGEAMNFGCVPIVSDVSSIGQYIKDKKNGFLIEPLSVKNLTTLFFESIEISPESYKKMQIENYKLTEIFTYEHYNNRIKEEIFR